MPTTIPVVMKLGFPSPSSQAEIMAELACFLRQQLELVPNAVIAALGGKAQDRVRRLGLTTDGKPRHVIEAVAAAPPGANHKNAKASWKKIAKAVHTRRA